MFLHPRSFALLSLLTLAFLLAGCLEGSGFLGGQSPVEDDDDQADDDDTTGDDDDSANDDDDSADDDDTGSDDDDTGSDDDDTVPTLPCDTFFTKAYVDNEFSVYHLDGTTIQVEPINPAGPGVIWTAVVADFTGDGNLDILAERSDNWPQEVHLHLFEGLCGNEFSKETLPPESGLSLSGLGADVYTAADVDGDGDNDVIGWGWYEGVGFVWLNGGDGRSWTLLAEEEGGEPPFDLEWWTDSDESRVSVASPPRDVTGDGRVDLVECSNSGSGDTDCIIHEGNGDGTFTYTGAGFFLPRLINGIGLADLNRDGIVEYFGGLDDDGDPGQAWLWQPAGPWALPSGPGIELVDLNPGKESGSDEAGYGWLYPWDTNRPEGIDLVAASLVGMENDATNIHYIENLGSSGFTATVLGNAWHSFGDNNMLMQDFIGTAP